MSHSDPHTPDPFDGLLREYLLENDVKGPDGESLLEVAFEHSEANLAPPASQEAALVNRMKQDFGKQPVPGPAATSTFSTRLAFFGSLAVAASLVVFLVFFFPPLEKPELENPTSPETGAYAAENEVDEGNIWSENTLPAINNDGENAHLDENNHPEKGTHSTKKRITSPRKRSPLSPALNPNQNLTSPNDPNYTDNNSPNIGPVEAPQEIVNPFPLKELFRQTVVPSNFFRINNDRGEIVMARGGTLLHFPPACFVKNNGAAIKGAVQVEIKEVYDAADFVLSNLPTISNGRQLISGGALYIEATAEGEVLKVDQGKDIYVEFATGAQAAKDMEMFQGKFNVRGEMNLVPTSNPTLQKTLVPLPIDLLGFDEFTCQCGKFWNDILYELSDKYFQNTWIATREFRERIAATRKLETGVDIYMTEILRIYRDNIDKPLWQVDQIVADFLREKQRVEGDGGRQYHDEVYQRFASQMLTGIEKFDDHGVKLDSKDAREQLIAKGVSGKEADRILRIYDLTRQYLGDPQGALYLGTPSKKQKLPRNMRTWDEGKLDKQFVAARRGYRLRQTGWASLGRILGPEYASGGPTLDVRLKGDYPEGKTTTYLVMSGMRSMVPARLIGSDEARFKDLPKNAKAYVVTIGYDEASPYLGMREVTLNGDRREEVVLKKTTFDDLVAQLKKLN